MTDRAEQPFDVVERPAHYNSHASGVEAIEVKRHLGSDWNDVFKYVFRTELKDGEQDLKKALWYAKDGIIHDLPVHAPSWTDETAQRLARIIDFESGVRRKFFIGFFHASPTVIVKAVQEMLQQ